MDLEDWELLPDDGFLEIHDDGGKKIFSRKYGTNSNSVFNMEYFICPSPSSQKFVESPPPEKKNSRLPKQRLVPVPFQLEPTTVKAPPDHHEVVVKEITKDPIEISILASEKTKGPINIGEAADQDTVSQVFFKKMKENEFVDMKLDSPKSGSSRGIMPSGTFQFEDKGEVMESSSSSSGGGGGKINCSSSSSSSKMKKVEKETVTKKNNHHLDSDTSIKKEEEEEEEEEEEDQEVIMSTSSNGGLNLWKWSLTGIGAICSFGVAAATICVIILGSGQRNKHHHHHQLNQQKLRFQIYTDDQRIKQVVHHATKLNEAISAVRGVPLARAHITYGGYYDGL